MLDAAGHDRWGRQMRVAVFGTGGAGGYFGAQLAMAGEDVVFIARGAHLRAINEAGLRLETPSGETTIRAKATDDPTDAGHVDAVLVGVKAWQVTEAARAMRPLVRSDTVVVPMQNGVEAAGELAAVFASNTLGGMCGTLSFVAGPGHIRSMGGRNFIKFGELDNQRTDRVERLRRGFARANVDVEVPADIVKALWDKFLMVTTFGGVGSITRAPIGAIRTVPETRRLLEQCLRETLAVAKARKVPMGDTGTTVAEVMKFYDSIPPNGTTSLQRDITGGKRSELDYWTGAVVRLGREVAVPTPTHQLIYDCLLPSELRAQEKISFA
jgi:2-dehydropantoate 2-reductase